jgi:hypothetical protein
MLHTHRLLLGLALVTLSTQLTAAECSAKSAKHTVPLLELYTSEGCSSCPPADQWLSGLKINDQKLVPLAFHVDYWDYIGWKDRFAKASYTERQRKSAAQGGLGFVYTPQFILNGKDFRSWNDTRLEQGINSIHQQPATAELSLNFSNKENGEILISAAAQTMLTDDAKDADVYVALYENKLNSMINAGENMGRTLKHDYVVRELFGPYTFDNKNQFSKAFILKSDWKTRNAGAVVFAQNRRSGSILQSLRLPLCN